MRRAAVLLLLVGCGPDPMVEYAAGTTGEIEASSSEDGATSTSGGESSGSTGEQGHRVPVPDLGGGESTGVAECEYFEVEGDPDSTCIDVCAGECGECSPAPPNVCDQPGALFCQCVVC